MKEEFKQWLKVDNYERCLGASFTMKQCIGWNDPTVLTERLDVPKAEQNFSHFMNLVNRKVLGYKFKRFKQRINVVPVLEKSSVGRYHYHAIFEGPRDYFKLRFKSVLERSWMRTKFADSQTHIDLDVDEGWLSYITKFKTSEDEIDWVNFYWN